MGLALHFEDVGQLPDLVEHAAQIGDTGDLHREGHVGEVLLFVGPRLHGDHVDLVVSQHRGNVAQQRVAVDCDDAYVDGIGLLLAAPLDLDEALRALDLIAQHIAAIAAMDGDAAAAGDVADDALARHWFAAARELGHEIADAHDTDAAALAARRGRRCGQLGKLVGHGRVYLLHSVHGLRGLHVAAADGREQVVGFGEVEAARNVVEIHRTETEALHLLLEGRATGRDVGLDVLLFEPVLHLGTRTRGAKVNGHIVTLTYSLQTGQQVELLTIKKGTPRRDWLNPHLGYLKPARARAKVQHWFKQQNVEANVAAGRAAFEKEVQRLGLGAVNFDDVARRLNFTKSDELFAAIGRGDVKTSQAVHTVQQIHAPVPDKLAELPAPAAAPRREGGGIRIMGVGNLMTQLARCCKPVPGEGIVGYITRGRGVTIHRRDCSNVLRYRNESPQRLIEVEWGGEQDTYPVDVRIIAVDRHGLLRDITSVLANDKMNVIAVQTRSDKQQHLAYMTLTMEIASVADLSRVLAKDGQLPNIIEVKRETH